MAFFSLCSNLAMLHIIKGSMSVQVTACPNDQATGSTFFIPVEDALESKTFTRGYLEAKMVVGLAGR